jgi:hypothetical protein
MAGREMAVAAQRCLAGRGTDDIQADHQPQDSHGKWALKLPPALFACAD